MTSPSDLELIEVLQKAMPETTIARIDRRLHDYRSSSVLEQLRLELTDGRTLPLVFKDVGQDSVTDEARGIKPKFIQNPRREIVAYRDILGPLDLGTARCWASVADAERNRFWLFLEDVPGKELYQYGELEVWQLVARRLATIHRAFDKRVCQLTTNTTAELLHFTPDYYRRWIKRAVDFAQRSRPADQARQLRQLQERYNRVIQYVETLPQGLIHGEFYASNILVDLTTTDGRVCPIDWEMAAVGPRLLDVAALIVGHWSGEQSDAIARAYLEEINRETTHYPSEEDFFTSVSYCRLVLAVQWLGWSEAWQPPEQHAFDWMAETLRLADGLL